MGVGQSFKKKQLDAAIPNRKGKERGELGCSLSRIKSRQGALKGKPCLSKIINAAKQGAFRLEWNGGKKKS